MNYMNTNTDATKNPSPALIPGGISRPAPIPAAAAENPMETNESSEAAHAADVGENETGHAADHGHEPDRIQPQSAEHHPTNEHHDDSGMAREPVTRSDEAASLSIAPSELSSFAKATLDEPPMAGGGLAAHAHHDAGARHLLAAAGTLRTIHESNAALSQILSELATETRQAAAAHGDSLRAIHGAIHELRRAHQEILSRLNQPQGQ
jgi:hypothetical protein